ncbi:MAG: glycoside hydrolase family 2 TIM barrel-domain containing protein [Thermoleophilaceae bacterium]
MTRILTSLSLALVLAAVAAAPAPAQVSVPSKRVLYADGHGGRHLMDGTWLFRLDPADQGLARGFARSRSAAGWTNVSVPNAWNATDLSDDSQRGTVGWYRKDFRLPRGARPAAWAFRFESVNYRARVFLNGREMGRHEGGYVPFEVPARAIRRRGVNRLVVRVDNRRTSNDLPPGRDQANGRPGGGWWNYGGLLREVYLRRIERVDLAELFARPVLPCRRCAATVVVRGVLRNPGRRPQRARLRVTVGGLRGASPAVRIPGRGSREVQARIRIPDPRLWEPGDPELYKLRARVQVGRRSGGSWSAHVGVRSLRVDSGGRMRLNGRPVQLRGASMHEDHPALGAALGSAERRFNVSLLQDLGATVTRAHYPLHPETYEMLDRSGILVWNQVPFYQLRNDAMRRRAVRDKGLRMLEAMIRRDRNHPSVFVWSVANELPTRISAGQRRYLQASAALVRRLDPSRLSGIDFAGYPTATPSVAYRDFDALGVNSYFGWYPGPSGQIVERDLLSPYIDQLHEHYPTEALFVTEFGAEANREGPIDERGTFAFQQEFMQFHVSTYDSNPHVNGAIAWILRDFRVRPDWDGGNPLPEPPVNFKGLVTMDGQRKPAFEDTARMYRNVAPLR